MRPRPIYLLYKLTYTYVCTCICERSYTYVYTQCLRRVHTTRSSQCMLNRFAHRYSALASRAHHCKIPRNKFHTTTAADIPNLLALNKKPRKSSCAPLTRGVCVCICIMEAWILFALKAARARNPWAGVDLGDADEGGGGGGWLRSADGW